MSWNQEDKEMDGYTLSNLWFYDSKTIFRWYYPLLSLQHNFFFYLGVASGIFMGWWVQCALVLWNSRRYYNLSSGWQLLQFTKITTEKKSDAFLKIVQFYFFMCEILLNTMSVACRHLKMYFPLGMVGILI